MAIRERACHMAFKSPRASCHSWDRSAHEGPLLALRPVDRSLFGGGRERRGLLPFVHHGRIPQEDLKPLHSMRADRGDPPEMVPSDPSLQRRVGEHDINPVVLLALGCLAGGARGTYVRPSREGQRCHHIKVPQGLVEVSTDERWDSSQRFRSSQGLGYHSRGLVPLPSVAIGVPVQVEDPDGRSPPPHTRWPLRTWLVAPLGGGHRL